MALVYNQPRFSQNLLSKYKECTPSFTINLYDDHWTLNKGPSKFLYTQPVSGLLDEVRALRIPVDFIEIFDAAKLPYYDGCMIVESIDHRKLHLQPTSKEPGCVRVVLQPTPESLYADLCLLNAKNGNTWTDHEALEAEAKLLNETCPSLCLDPDINLTRIVNTVIRASTPHDSVVSKRKHVHEPEEDENDKAKRAKLWSQYMHPHNGKPSSQARQRSMFDILNEVAQKDEKGVYSLKWKPQPKNESAPYPSQSQPQNNPPFAPSSAITAASMPSTASQDDQKPKKAMMMVKRPDTADLPAPAAPVVKGKKKPMTNANVPATAPSPVLEQRKIGSVMPGVSRTPVDAAVLREKSPHPPPQFQPLPLPQPQPSVSPHPPGPLAVAPSVASSSQKKRGVLKKPEDQTVQPPAHPQLQQPNSMDSQTTAWQPPMPSAQYLSQPPQKKPQPTQQVQQSPPFQARTPVPGFANNSYPQNAGYKNTGGTAQNPNINTNRGSPMAHNPPLLSRDPLPSHSQSPRLPSQQPQPQQAPAGPQYPLSHPNHQFNMHLQQNRYSSTMQAQPGHHTQPMSQHPITQQHHTPPTNASRSAPGQHDPSQPMMHPQMQYNPMAFSYQMQMQGMMNGVRMTNLPGGQGAVGQYMPGPAWRVPPGRGGGPAMATIPMNNQQFQQQQQQMLAAMNRAQQHAQAQQAQQAPQGQGR